MNYCVRALLSTVALALMMTVAAWAGATPSRLNYQGLLTDANGQPLNATSLPMTFRIWAHPYSSDPADLKWQETLLVNVTDGLFSVILGDQLPIADSVFSTSERFLGISIGDEAEGTPRTRLVSVGYSTRVETLDGARGGVISGAIGLAPAPTTKDTDAEDLRFEIVDELQTVTYYANSEEVFTPCVLFAGDDSRQCTAALNAGAAQAEDTEAQTAIAATPTVLAQATIMCPADGFVLVMASCEAALDHEDEDFQSAVYPAVPTFTAEFGVSSSASELPADQHKRWSITNVEPYYRARNVISVQKVFSVAAGSSTFYFLGKQTEGNKTFTAEDKTITLVFIPKAYGEVSASNASGRLATAAPVEVKPASVTTSSPSAGSEIAQLKAEVAEMRALLKQALNGSTKP